MTATPDTDVNDPPVAVPVARTLVVGAAVFSLLQLFPVGPRLLVPGLGLVIVVLCLTVLATRWRGEHGPDVARWLLTFAVGVGVAMASWQPMVGYGFPLGAVLPVVLGIAAVVAIESSGRRASIAFAIMLGAFALLTLIDFDLLKVRIDVQLFLQGGLDATLSGHSPYGITIADRYDAADTAQYYPPGTVVDGRVQFGYPYLPAPLLLDIPAHLLGDVRWMHLGALLGSGALAWSMAKDRIGRAASILLVVNPLSSLVLVLYFVEPVIILLLALTVWGMMRRQRWTGVVLGLFFASKQYAVSFVPVLWSVGRSVSWRTVWVATAVGVVCVSVFVVWDPGAFMHTAVGFQLRQQLRDDAVSVLPGLTDIFGPLPPWLLNASPVVGLLASALVAARTKAGPTALALGVGLSMLVVVLLAKQAFMNYYFFIGAALLLAVVIWPSDDPIPAEELDA